MIPANRGTRLTGPQPGHLRLQFYEKIDSGYEFSSEFVIFLSTPFLQNTSGSCFSIVKLNIWCQQPVSSLVYLNTKNIQQKKFHLVCLHYIIFLSRISFSPIVNIFALYNFFSREKNTWTINFYKILLSGDAAIERISPFLYGFKRLQYTKTTDWHV